MADGSGGSGSPGGEADDVVQRPIQRLPEHVVNKIAAGEIIHRPANALKEMMENSLDAGATMIRIQLKDGGLKMLQIQDDGRGVPPSDMALLCERFATSKLRDFSDLSRMTTFGFRGEALASISYVSANMTVLSKTQDSEVAYKACYSSGALAPPKPGQSASPKACAGSLGTTITVEDLFYNVPQRRRSLKSASDEYNLTLDVVSKYAVHYGSRAIGFTCKKVSANTVDLSVPSSPSTSTLDVISLVYGSSIAKELQHLSPHHYAHLGCSVQGWVSGANWSAKRTQFLCFINNRLVDCPALKRSLVALYSTLLPRGGHPWIYLSLDLSPEKVDVNVHPTKREVHFLDEEEIVEVVCSQVQQLLADANASRNFQLTQAVLTGHVGGPANRPASSMPLGPSSSRPGYPQHMIRVDGKTRTLDAMSAFTTSTSRAAAPTPTMDKTELQSKLRGTDEGWTVTPWEDRPPAATPAHSTKIEESKSSLQSVQQLRLQVQTSRHHGLTALFENYTLVGVVDSTKSLSLVQHGTKLYLVQYDQMMEEIGYQMILRQFASLTRFRLSPSPLLADLIQTALLYEEPSLAVRQALGLQDDEVIIERVTRRLISHADLLSEYFSLDIDASTGRLIALPNLFASSSSPSQEVLFNLERLPTLMLRLATQVDWEDETKCLQAILRELALAHLPSPAMKESEEAGTKERVERDWVASWSRLIRLFVPPTSLAQTGVTEVASLPSLYSVFERC